MARKKTGASRKLTKRQKALAEKALNQRKDSTSHPTKQCTTRPAQMTSQIPPCTSSHAISRPTDPPRTSDMRPTPSIQGAHSPCSSQPTNSDAGRTHRSFVALETQSNDAKPTMYLVGQGFLPSRPAANEIGDILKSHYTDPWPSWKEIPISTRDLWFGEFLKKFSVSPPNYDLAKKNFEMQGSTILKSILLEARTSMVKPNWIKDGVWEKLCEHWKSEDLRRKSIEAKTNRACRDNMSKETGTPLRHTHQDNDNTWVDIQEDFTRTLEKLTKSAFEQGNPPPSDLDVWCDVVRTNKRKGYGLAMESMVMAGGSCYHGSSSSVEWVTREQFDELKKLMKEIRSERDKLRTRVANIERLAEHNNTLIRELMVNMNMPLQ
ncbi:hypothetical protein Fmac_027165 [Flemingia macrophylla]|uniref:Transposase n=1 Tax=Flemingia macrophylla TaxID=520843 RepID=A0ABD1LH28_9FABA